MQWAVRRILQKKIIEKNAYYILQVKDNQKRLREQIEDTFKTLPIQASNTELDMGHGRIEVRKCDVISNLEFVEQQPYWKDLQSVVRISAEITEKKQD